MESRFDCRSVGQVLACALLGVLLGCASNAPGTTLPAAAECRLQVLPPRLSVVLASVEARTLHLARCNQTTLLGRLVDATVFSVIQFGEDGVVRDLRVDDAVGLRMRPGTNEDALRADLALCVRETLNGIRIADWTFGEQLFVVTHIVERGIVSLASVNPVMPIGEVRERLK